VVKENGSIPAKPAPEGEEKLPKAKHAHSKGTQIVCTLGPATRTVDTILPLLQKGMNVARLNFSHGSYEYHAESLLALRQACEVGGRLCGVMLDTRGPEVRTGKLRNGQPVTYQIGQTITITGDYSVVGDQDTIAISYPQLCETVEIGSRILMADGTFLLEVTAIDYAARTVKCQALNTAKVGELKNCNLPGAIVDLPVLTDKDRRDLLWGIENSVDFIAVSFVRTARDVATVRSFLDANGGRWIKIIAKIENQQGLDNVQSIIETADGVMVARGDLGMELKVEHMFAAQKQIIAQCNRAGKPVITATQMLESMCWSPRPTRAEATDVANAVLDGTDAVMLSGETAKGNFAGEAVRIMASICEEAEKCSTPTQPELSGGVRPTRLPPGPLSGHVPAPEPHRTHGEPLSVIEALSSSAAFLAGVLGVKCIVVLAANGKAARLIAKYRPNVPVVVGVVPRRRRDSVGFKDRYTSGHTVARQLLLTRGLVPVVIPPLSDPKQLDGDEEEAGAAKRLLHETIKYARDLGLIQSGEQVVTMYNVELKGAVIRVVPCP